jgi:hypothetical protein
MVAHGAMEKLPFRSGLREITAGPVVQHPAVPLGYGAVSRFPFRAGLRGPIVGYNLAGTQECPECPEPPGPPTEGIIWPLTYVQG